MKLLVDVGNTRAKWAVLDGGPLHSRGAALHRGVPAARWVAGLDALAGPFEAIWVSNVAGPAVAHALGEWALERHGLRPEFVRATRAAGGIENSYAHPEALGVDRWLGMIGAWQRVRAPLLCIAAGTALTIDALDGRGRHRGGLIAPGYDLMMETLMHRTSDIAPGAALAPPEGDGLFGRNTAAAVELGVTHAMAALAERAVRTLEAGTGRLPAVFLGGGDAARIESLLGVPATLAPELVLEGLSVVAGES